MGTSRNLTAAVHQEEDWYVAQCLEVDVASQGRTIPEALNNLAEAVELYASTSEVPAKKPLNRLIDEHGMRQVHAAYARLRDDSGQWADYQQELGLAESTAADGLGNARDEYPEYHR